MEPVHRNPMWNLKLISFSKFKVKFSDFILFCKTSTVFYNRLNYHYFLYFFRIIFITLTKFLLWIHEHSMISSKQIGVYKTHFSSSQKNFIITNVSVQK